LKHLNTPTVQVELEQIASHKEVQTVLNQAFFDTLTGDTARIRQATEGMLRSLTIQFNNNRSVRVGFYVTDLTTRTIEGNPPSSIPELFLFALHISKLTALNITYSQATTLASKLLAFEGFSPSELDNAKSVLEAFLNT